MKLKFKKKRDERIPSSTPVIELWKEDKVKFGNKSFKKGFTC